MRPLWRHDAVVLTMGALSIALVYWYESGLPPDQARLVIMLDLVFVGYFLADWIAVWRSQGWGYKWVLWNGWRLLGMIPLLVASFAFLRLLRLARILPVLEHIRPLRRGTQHLRETLDWNTLRPLAFAAASITFGGAFMVWLAERATNPDLAEFSEAVWWAIVTVTTVGYGDITPLTPIGRLVAVGLMVTGIGTIGMLASQVSSAMITKGSATIEEEVVAQADPSSIAGQLSQLAVLHDLGKLTDREFTDAKTQLLQR